jgi:hypothetical protein
VAVALGDLTDVGQAGDGRWSDDRGGGITGNRSAVVVIPPALEAAIEQDHASAWSARRELHDIGCDFFLG